MKIRLLVCELLFIAEVYSGLKSIWKQHLKLWIYCIEMNYYTFGSLLDHPSELDSDSKSTKNV